MVQIDPVSSDKETPKNQAKKEIPKNAATEAKKEIPKKAAKETNKKESPKKPAEPSKEIPKKAAKEAKKDAPKEHAKEAKKDTPKEPESLPAPGGVVMNLDFKTIKIIFPQLLYLLIRQSPISWDLEYFTCAACR